MKTLRFSPSYVICATRMVRLPIRHERYKVGGSTSLVVVLPRVPSVSFVYRKYEVGGQLQLPNAVKWLYENLRKGLPHTYSSSNHQLPAFVCGLARTPPIDISISICLYATGCRTW